MSSLQSLFQYLLWGWIVTTLSEVWVVPQPQKNIWVTLAHALKQDQVCLSSVNDPLSTCLVGILLQPSEHSQSLVTFQNKVNSEKAPDHVFTQSCVVYKIQLPITNPLALWREWIENLPKLENELQEFELIGSTCTHFCIHFDFKPHCYYHYID